MTYEQSSKYKCFGVINEIGMVRREKDEASCCRTSHNLHGRSLAKEESNNAVMFSLETFQSDYYYLNDSVDNTTSTGREIRFLKLFASSPGPQSS